MAKLTPSLMKADCLAAQNMAWSSVSGFRFVDSRWAATYALALVIRIGMSSWSLWVPISDPGAVALNIPER